MLPLGISLITAAAGTVFGIALLWVMTQWLKADEAQMVSEREVRRNVEELQAQAAEQLRQQAEAMKPATGLRPWSVP